MLRRSDNMSTSTTNEYGHCSSLKRKSNFFHRLFFWYELVIIIKGWKRKLTEKDLHPILEEYQSDNLGNKLEKVWLEDTKKGGTLLKTFIHVFGTECWIYGLLLFPIDLILALLQPFLLKKLLDYHTPNQTSVTKAEAYMYTSSIVLLSLIYILIFHTVILELYNLGMKLRIACTTLLFRKCLRMKKHTLQQATVGKIINLLSNDVYRFDLAFSHFHYMWMSPIKVLASTYYLYVTFGQTSVIGISAIIIALLIQVYVSKQSATVRKNMAAKTDYRIRLLTDVISGIQLIKMCSWEKPFSKLVTIARNLEIEEITLANHFRICSSIIKIYVPKISVFLCVLANSLARLPLTSQYVFSLTNLYENLKFTAIIRMPMAFFRFAEAKISVQRFQDFLQLDCNKDNYNLKTPEKVPGVLVTDVSVKWDNSLRTNTLTSVNICASLGEVVSIVGPPGSGKSTLLQVILNELDLLEGVVHVGGRVSYASQEPWIFSGTIKDNILFGLDLDKNKYYEVLGITALSHDLSQFPYGDNTLVGEKGLTLSGGQKARINLARAIYRDADIYLLDDPLSAVDAHVAKHIFDKCIRNYLKTKCVILVTHQVQYLQRVDKIYALESGRVIKVVQPQEIASIKNCLTKHKEQDFLVVKPSEALEVKTNIEDRRGAARDYTNYCAAGGPWFVFASIFLLLTFNQALGYMIDCFVAVWVNLSSRNENTFTNSDYLYIYAILVTFLTFSTHLGSWVFVRFCTQVSRNVHSTMFSSILGAPIKFFQDNSSGSIMNRFSKDMSHIDEFIPASVNEVITQILMVLGLTVVLCFINPWMTVPSLLIYVVFYYCAIIFQPTNINVRRMEANARSPIFTHLNASLHGLTTIKALRAEKILEDQFNKYQDLHTSTFVLFRSLFASFGFWVDVILLLYTGAVAFSFFYMTEVRVGDVGLAITLSTILGGMIQLGMKSWGELDSYISSVERVVEYGKIPQELDFALLAPPESWPMSGNICFQNVSMRYSFDSPLVLKEVSFEITAGEKIGVIGRTGAGKTSLTSALFRLFEFEGVITIDNVNTKSIPLSTLRSKIAIIPQDPVLFLGSLRKNLDPFNEFTDLQLWQALEEVQLKETVSCAGLDTEVSESGSNFSVGQKQLLCLARTILKNTKIIVLDEATANVDFHTDKIIQSTIRKRFLNCTVLTIAHRVNTVMDSDKILVMENGGVAEFGAPDQLLKNENGFFYGCVKKNNFTLL